MSTTTSWTTSADIPPSAWAAMVADMRALLAVTAAGGATVTDAATGTGSPVLDDETVSFTVTMPKSQPLAVTFHRAAGTGTVVTNAPHTDGLVLATLARASQHWGALLTVESDAGTTSRGCGAALVDRLFGSGDRALSSTPGLSVPSQAGIIVQRAYGGLDPSLPLLGYLDALIAQLQAERAGIATAVQLVPTPA